MRVYFPPAEQHGEKLSDEQATDLSTTDASRR
jgi:hypothetical protein